MDELNDDDNCLQMRTNFSPPGNEPASPLTQEQNTADFLENQLSFNLQRQISNKNTELHDYIQNQRENFSLCHENQDLLSNLNDSNHNFNKRISQRRGSLPGLVGIDETRPFTSSTCQNAGLPSSNSFSINHQTRPHFPQQVNSQPQINPNNLTPFSNFNSFHSNSAGNTQMISQKSSGVWSSSNSCLVHPGSVNRNLSSLSLGSANSNSFHNFSSNNSYHQFQNFNENMNNGIQVDFARPDNVASPSGQSTSTINNSMGQDADQIQSSSRSVQASHDEEHQMKELAYPVPSSSNFSKSPVVQANLTDLFENSNQSSKRSTLKRDSIQNIMSPNSHIINNISSNLDELDIGGIDTDFPGVDVDKQDFFQQDSETEEEGNEPYLTMRARKKSRQRVDLEEILLPQDLPAIGDLDLSLPTLTQNLDLLNPKVRQSKNSSNKVKQEYKSEIDSSILLRLQTEMSGSRSLPTNGNNLEDEDDIEIEEDQIDNSESMSSNAGYGPLSLNSNLEGSSFSFNQNYENQKILAGLNIDDEKLIQYPVRELNKYIKNFTKEQQKALKARRRTLKNRGYAQICRKRRVDQKLSLEQECKQFKSCNLELVKQLEELKGYYRQCKLERDALLIENQKLKGRNQENQRE